MAWRHARITRLLGEIVALKPAAAAPAGIATQLLILRELTDTLTARVHAPGVTTEQRCRHSRTVADLDRSATTLDWSLKRHQQTPVPFFGAVVQDEVDNQAIDAIWCSRAKQREAAPKAVLARTPAGGAAAAARGLVVRREPRPARPVTAPPTADAEPSAAVLDAALAPTPLPPDAAAMEVQSRRDRSPDPVTRAVPASAGAGLSGTPTTRRWRDTVGPDGGQTCTRSVAIATGG